MNQPIKINLTFEEYKAYRAAWWSTVPRFTRLTSFMLDLVWIGLLITILVNWIGDGNNDWTTYGTFVLVFVISIRYDHNLKRRFESELLMYLLKQEQAKHES